MHSSVVLQEPLVLHYADLPGELEAAPALVCRAGSLRPGVDRNGPRLRDRAAIARGQSVARRAPLLPPPIPRGRLTEPEDPGARSGLRPGTYAPGPRLHAAEVADAGAG